MCICVFVYGRVFVKIAVALTLSFWNWYVCLCVFVYVRVFVEIAVALTLSFWKMQFVKKIICFDSDFAIPHINSEDSCQQDNAIC